MKFLLEFVPCFGSSAADQPPADETQSLMRQPPPRRRRKRSRVAGQPGSAAAGAEWRPSLSSISEDRPAVTAKVGKSGTERPATDAGERQVRRKSGGGSSGSDRAHVRHRSGDFGRNAYETVIPAFSPTPFMF